MDANKVIARAKGMLLTPRSEWAVAAAEPDTIGGLYSGYILLLAAIPSVVSFISSTMVGVSVPFLGVYRIGMGAALTSAVLRYALALVGVYVVAFIVDALAPSFGAEKSRTQALKAVAYSYTAFWVISIVGVVPGLALIAALGGGIYSIFLLNMGLPFTMKCPAEKSVGYTALTVVVAIVVSVVLGLVIGSVAGVSMGVGRGLSGLSQPSVTNPTGFANGTAGAALHAWSQKMKDASDQAAAAQKSGDKDAQAQAVGAMVGAALGSGGKVEALAPERIRPFLPDSLGNLKRTQLQVERNGAMGMQVSTGTATYSDGSQHSVTVTITDTGSLKGLFGFAAGWAGAERESQTDTGYEKMYKSGGQLIHEKWDSSSHSGEYGVVVGDRFSVNAQGTADRIDDLKAAVAAINLSGLEALKNEGTSPN